MSSGAPSGSRGEDTPHPHGAQPEWVTAALLIAGVTVVARVIGFVRYLVLARTVGTTCLGDVYATANAVPNIVYELVVGGALVALVVPLVAGARASDPDKVRAVVAALHGWSLLLLVPVTAVIYLASGWVIELLLGSTSACGSAADQTSVEMLWVFLLQIPVYGATVIAQGALQSHHRFLAPAVAPAVSSVLMIASYGAYAVLAGDHRGSLEDLTTAEFWILAGGTTAAVFALLVVQIPALRRADLVVWPSLRFPEGRSRQAITLAWSGAVVVGSQWVAYALAIRWSNVYGGEGSALVFVLAWTVFLLPWAVLAFPIATATFPRLSSLYARGDRDEVTGTIALSLRTIIAASAVGAAGLAAAAQPLAVLMVQGAPGTDAVPMLAGMLVALAPGVIAYGAHGHLVRVLAAGHRSPSAAAGTVVGWAVALVAAGTGVRAAEGATEVARAIGIGFSVGVTVAAVLLAVLVRLRDGRRALRGVLRMTVAVSVTALVVGWLGHLAIPSTGSVGAALLQLLGVGVVSLAAVGGVALLVDPQSARGLLRLRSRAGLDEG